MKLTTPKNNATILPHLQEAMAHVQIRHQAQSLSVILQNYPLQRVLAQARGRAVESYRVEQLEERATRAALVELRNLTNIALSITDQPRRPGLFRDYMPVFVEALAFRDGDWSVREATVRALGAIYGDNRIIPLMRYLILHDRNPNVRLAAATELAHIGGMDGAMGLICVLGTDDPGAREIATAFYQSKPNRRFAIRALEAGLRDAHPTIRHNAADLLDSVEWQPVDAEARGWRVVASQSWEEVKLLKEDALPGLENALCGKNARIRQKVAEVLTQMGWVTDEYRMRAAYHVARLEWNEAARLKVAAAAPLVNALEGDETAIIAAASDALVEIGYEAIPALLNVLPDQPDRAILRMSCRVIGRIAIKCRAEVSDRASGVLASCVGPMLSIMRDEHNRVIVEAATALADIAENIPDRTTVNVLFTPVLDVLREILRRETSLVVQSIQTARDRISRSCICATPNVGG